MTLILSAFFIGFFIESIFGLGGTIISMTILSFFIDIKTLIFLGIFAGTTASIFVLITDYKNLSFKKFLHMTLYAFLGVILGAISLNIISSETLLKLFAIFLIIFSLHSIFGNKLNIPKFLEKILLFLSGVIHGLFGTGGPFVVAAMKENFQNKSELRSTLALFFITFNLVRSIQYFQQNSFDFSSIQNYWLIMPCVALAIILGYFIHVKISEKWFRTGISFLLLLSGVTFLFL